MLRDGLLRLSTLWAECLDESLMFDAEAMFFRIEFPRRLIELLTSRPVENEAPKDAQMAPASDVASWAKDITGVGPRLASGRFSGAAVTFQAREPTVAELPNFQVRYVFSKDLDAVFLGLFVHVPGRTTRAELRKFVRNAREYIGSRLHRSDREWSDPDEVERMGLSPYFECRAVFTRSYRLDNLPDETVLLQELRSSLGMLSDLAIAVSQASAEELRLSFGSNLASLYVAFEYASTAYVARPSRPEPKKVKVWFGTNRLPHLLDDGTLWLDHPDGPFGSEDSEALRFGACTVSIPESHRFGGVKSWFERLCGGGDKLELEEALLFGFTDAFLDSIRASLNGISQDQRAVLVYIHGYNVTFREAAIRAAQLGADLSVPITAFYSWPSRGTTAGYLADSAAIDASEPRLIEFLKTVANLADSAPIHLLVHSMGNRAMIRVLEQLAPLSLTAGFKFGQVILAAPDVDARVFRQRAAMYSSICSRTTLYVSRKDLALKVSKALSSFPRAGLCPPVTVVSGVDTIEVTKIDVSQLGHGYYSSAAPLLYDIADLFNRGVPPSKRIRLSPVPDLSTAEYWFLRA